MNKDEEVIQGLLQQRYAFKDLVFYPLKLVL
jgi:hypothetical protein